MALILIDLQRDFEKYLTSEMVTGLKETVSLARERKMPIVWIRSQYDQQSVCPSNYIVNPTLDQFITLTHTGKKSYCLEGSPGAEWSDRIVSLIKEQDLVITKTNFSSFKETNLHNYLHKKGITKLYIGGIATNVCILATAYHATKLQYSILVGNEITNAFSKQKHLHGLNRIATFARHVDNKGLYEEMTTVGSGSRIYYNVVPTSEIDTSLERLKEEISWSEMFSHGSPVPRLVAIQSDFKDKEAGLGQLGMHPLYRHPIDKQPETRPWTPTVETIRDFLTTKFGFTLNHCLIQLYRDHTDYIGEHSDKTLDISPDSFIVNFSVGATRKMTLAHKTDKAQRERIHLRNNSLLAMNLKTNAEWLHSISPSKAPKNQFDEDELAFDSQRISFTFRHITTWFNPETREISGQGAKKDRNVEEDDAHQMFISFREENKSSNFDWSQHYGNGFNAIQMHDLKGDFVKVLHPPKRLDPVLYYVNGSVPSWRVELMLKTKGVNYTKKREKVMTCMSERLKELNPRGLTPVLILTNGRVLSESWAINYYLEREFQPRLLPENSYSYAKTLQLAHASDDLLKSYAPIEMYLFQSKELITETVKEKVKVILKKVQQELLYWEKTFGELLIKGKEEGEDISFVDIMFFPVLAYIFHRGISLDPHPNLKEYYNRLSRLKLVREVHPEGWKLGCFGKTNVVKLLKR